MTKHTDEIFGLINDTHRGGGNPPDSEISEAVAKIEALTAPETTGPLYKNVETHVRAAFDAGGGMDHSTGPKDDAACYGVIDAATDAIVKLITADQAPALKLYDRHAEVKLSNFVGEIIELKIRFNGGFVEVCGRVRRVHGGTSCDTVLWVGEICVPCDTVVFLDSNGRQWVFESTRYQMPNAPKAIDAGGWSGTGLDKIDEHRHATEAAEIATAAKESGLDETIFDPIDDPSEGRVQGFDSDGRR